MAPWQAFIFTMSNLRLQGKPPGRAFTVPVWAFVFQEDSLWIQGELLQIYGEPPQLLDESLGYASMASRSR
jgi:hypothetical protein